MISKELFVEGMECIEYLYRASERIGEVLNVEGIVTFTSSTEVTLMKLLCETMGLEYSGEDIISHWVCETDFGKAKDMCVYNDTTIDNAKDLYEYIKTLN